MAVRATMSQRDGRRDAGTTPGRRPVTIVESSARAREPSPAEGPRVAAFAADHLCLQRLAAVLSKEFATAVWPSFGAVAGGILIEGEPDLVVVGCTGLDDETVSALRALRGRLPSARLVAVAPVGDRKVLRLLLDGVVDGFVLDGEAEAKLAPAVRAVCSGQLVFPQELRARLARPALSARERQVLALVVLGFTNDEIARKLHVVQSTVKSHLTSAFAKLGVRSRNEATALILDPENGLGTGILAISPSRASSA